MTKDLVIVADTHMTSKDAELDGFVRFLDRVGGEAGTVAHLGDLFNIWLGRPRFEMDHMKPVLDAFRALRRRGARTILVEGNRDFHTRHSYEGDAFDDVTEDIIDVPMATGPAGSMPGSLRMAHGDLVNVNDTQYRTWRRFSKSGAMRNLVGLLPSAAGIGLAERLERKLRGTNTRHKSYFPEAPAREYAARAFARGVRLIFLGHFHEERVIAMSPGSSYGGGGELVILPDWRSSHRFVRVTPDGRWRFEDWNG